MTTNPHPGGAHAILPTDADQALLVGRVWDPETGGPRPVRVRGEDVHDLFDVAPTVAGLLERDDAATVVAGTTGDSRWRLTDLVEASLARTQDRPHLLAPLDLQVVKACGVTFVDSMIERVIEERSAGDPARARQVRETLAASLHAEIDTIEPGSEAAARVKEVFLAEGLWSQYLEVGLGPDPEVFTKAPVLSSVGYGAQVGIPAFSSWNNPEPELVLVVDSRGRVRGCTLGNDVNLRDVEGRSALLLGMAKDNNASSAIGPFIRLFDDAFTVDTVRTERITLRVEGAEDCYVLEDENNVARLSRSFERLVEATSGDHHQYPDGFALYTGTLFAPTQDRGVPGLGFTHKIGDRVTIASPHLGTLTNEVAPTDSLPRWEFGIRSLVDYLHRSLRST
ncbi:fumarylacetoacetate hydrolase family protein [Occultella aeris]|uniref:Fumarylacetoacetate (FAA) hydrolase family protein n=1 Tax=Occultella aeris TaxID=2761496 RepID=A0A7M4DGG2_9MICO|nr:fumarylacetoacetate hydrolase family protein [Occultella aeris]VZO36005.1 Fumarylacetoacetate (FAA) hydrolase family protein [Occultella aeris]